MQNKGKTLELQKLKPKEWEKKTPMNSNPKQKARNKTLKKGKTSFSYEIGSQ
jgi:hypothetical protein